MKIRWQERVSNREIAKLANINDISCEVEEKRMELDWAHPEEGRGK